MATAKKSTEMTTAADALDLDPKERPNKALTEGPEGVDVKSRTEYLTKSLAATVGGGKDAEKAAGPIAEAMAQRQIDEVPSRAEREAR